MVVLNGLMDGQVFQRNGKNVCDVVVSGNCSNHGHIQVRVIQNGKDIRGLSGKIVAQVRKMYFSFRLKGIPVGGPYKIILGLINSNGRICEQFEVKNVMVGDVWILAGQSNMEGVALLKDAVKPSKFVKAFYMDDRWETAKDPIHKLSEAVDQVHIDLEGGVRFNRGKYIGAGLGVSFGKRMYRLTNVPQGLICCAHGGTNMLAWDPALKYKGQKSLYGAMIRRFIRNGSNVAGMVWYQGEAEANKVYAGFYTKRMKRFIEVLRRDLSNVKLPIVMAQLSRFIQHLSENKEDCTSQKGWNSIQQQQILLQQKIKRISVVPTIDLSLTDFIHLDGVSQSRLGIRLANAMFILRNSTDAGKKQIQVINVKTKVFKLMNSWDIEISYKNVENCLMAQDKPAGFSLVDSNGKIHDVIYRTDIQGDKIILKTILPITKSHDLYLHYGYGVNPYCNITDTNDRSLPVFGPCRIRWIR